MVAKQLFCLYHLKYICFCHYLKCCSDGIRLPLEDEKFVIEKVLEHHPEKEKKVSGEIDHIMVWILVLPFALYIYFLVITPLALF